MKLKYSVGRFFWTTTINVITVIAIIVGQFIVYNDFLSESMAKTILFLLSIILFYIRGSIQNTKNRTIKNLFNNGMISPVYTELVVIREI